MRSIKEIRARKSAMNSLADNIYYISKKAKYYHEMRLNCRNIFNGIWSFNYNDYKSHLINAFKILNYDVLETTIDNKEYIVITRNIEKILIYIERNDYDIKKGYLSEAITISFVASILHCNNKCIITKLEKKDISLEYIRDCKIHNISLMDYSWNESIFNIIINDLTKKYEYCKEKIKESSELIYKIQNEPYKRTKEKPRFNLSEIITNNDLEQIKKRLELDIMDEVFCF